MKLNLALAACLFGVALSAPILKAEAPHQEVAGKETDAAQMLEGYSTVATALYKDDLAAAKKAAGEMVKHDKDSAMGKHSKAIADSKSLEEARTHFKALSDAAIPVAKAEKTMHEMHCPMAFDNKGANWLQKSAEEVQNPYFGSKMPHCGKAAK
jgi:hypothetical protein